MQNNNILPDDENLLLDPEFEVEQKQTELPVINIAAAMNPKDAIRDLPAAGVSLDETALATKKILEAQERVPFIIPLDPGEMPGAYRSVIINGYRFEIKKNVMVYLPMAVARLLMESYNVENTVLANHPSNLNAADGEKRRALA